MEIKDVEYALSKALTNPHEELSNKEYTELVWEYLKEKKSNDEIISIIIEGLEVDGASTFFEYFSLAQKNDIPSIWKQIRENKTIIENKDNNGLRFLIKLFTISFSPSSNIVGLSGNIISKITSIVDNAKKPISSKVYKEIIITDFVEKVFEKSPFPAWESFKINGTSCKRFADIILESIEGEENNYSLLRRWASQGLEYADELIEKERIEATIPKSKVEELSAIVEHYKLVEKQITDNAYLIANLDKEILNYQEQIKIMMVEKKSLEDEIDNLSQIIADYKEKISESENEIEARKRINDAADALNKNDKEALLRDIANDLKTEFRDFEDSENDEMDEQLGEIYREKIRNIFKILKNKGIVVE